MMGSPPAAKPTESSDALSSAPASGLFPRRAPSRAEPRTWRGALWSLVVAVNFFLMSNPLVFVVNFDAGLRLAVLITISTVVVTFPWVRTPRVALPVVAYLAWTLASYSWSILPLYTSEAWAQSAVVASVAVLIYTNVSAQVLVTGFVIGGAAVSVASVYSFHERLPGAYYESQFGPALAGIGTNPNILAYTLTLSLCAVCAAFPSGILPRATWVSALALITYALSGADSATGDLTAAVIVVSAVFLCVREQLTHRFIRSNGDRALIVALTAVGVFGAYLVLTRVWELDLNTFSNRSPFWAATVAVAQDRPLVGFGWGAVWPHPWKPALPNVVIGDIWERAELPLSHGHNSAVDLLIEVGLVGVSLLALVMVAAAVRCVGLMRMAGSENSNDKVMARFISLCLVNLLVFGITEPMATIPLGWWALVLLTEPAALGTTQARHRGRR